MAKTTATTIRVKKQVLSILETLFEELDSKERWATQKYVVVGETDEQETDWHGNLKWEDDECTIPKYKKIWEYVDKEPDELDDDDRAIISAVNTIRATLERLI